MAWPRIAGRRRNPRSRRRNPQQPTAVSRTAAVTRGFGKRSGLASTRLASALATFVPPVALAALLAALAVGVGRRCLGRERADGEGLALALPLGLAALGPVAFALLALDLLRPWPVMLAGALAAALAVPGLLEVRRDLAALRSTVAPRSFHLAVAGIGASVGLLAALALYPPTAWDATIYHLPLARAFVEAGGFVFVAPLRFPVFPLLAESLFAVLDLVAGDLATQQLQVLSTVGTALLVAAWAGARLGRGRGGPLLATAIVLGSPIVVLYAGTAFVDPLLSLFTTGSLVALDRFRREGERRWALLAGALAGGAAAVKYLGLFFAAVVPLAVACGASTGEARERRRRLALGTATALLVSLALAPWYLRLVALTGNPVFPFASRLFGESAWQAGPMTPFDPRARAGGQLPDGPDALPTRLAAFPRLPFDLLLARSRYNQQPPFSPAIALLWPALALAAWRRPWARPLTLVWLGYALCLLPLPADSRYLLPIYPLAALLLAAATDVALELARTPRRTARILTVTGSALLALGLPLYACFHLLRQGPIPAGPSARREYLARTVPGYRGLAVAAARGRSETVYLLHLERLHYFAAGKGLGDFLGPARYATVEPHLGDPVALHARLQALGARLLLVPRAQADRLPRDAAFSRRFRSLHLDDEVELLELLPAEG